MLRWALVKSRSPYTCTAHGTFLARLAFLCFKHTSFNLYYDVRKEVVGGFTWSSFFGLYNVVGLGEFYYSF